MTKRSLHKLSNSEKYLIWGVVGLLAGMMTMALVFWIDTRNQELNQYSEWYCTVIYGRNSDCSMKGGE